jgi:hypothetical protein
MLSPRVKSQLDRLLTAQQQGMFTAAEFGMQAGILVSAENIGEVLEYVPQALHDPLKEGIAYDNQRAADEEILHPEKSPFHLPPVINQYYLDVGRLLLESVKPKRGKWRLSVVCLPSFEEEWAIQLFESRQSIYKMVLAVAERKIWGTWNASPSAIRCSETDLPGELAQGICETWNKMLSRVRHPRTPRLGLDGVRYHFALGQKAGQTWSPDDNTAPGRLVNLCHLLYEFVEGVVGGQQQELLEKIQVAIAWFRELN